MNPFWNRGGLLQLGRIFSLDYLPWMGGGIVGLALLPIPVFLMLDPPACSVVKESKPAVTSSFELKLPLREAISPLCTGGVDSQVVFSIDVPCPSQNACSSRLMVRLSQSKQVKKVDLPVKLDLEFGENGELTFAPTPSLFWLEIDTQSNAKLMCADTAGIAREMFHWKVTPQEAPVLSAEELHSGTPLRELAEGRWLGQDLFELHCGYGAVVHRLEIGVARSILNLQFHQWLCYQDGKWKTMDCMPENNTGSLARIRRVNGRGLELEGWEDGSYVRLILPPVTPAMVKTKGDELFSQLRIRSEKQISCVLDKQCLILRPGDWVIKLDQRWKLLRKKEEREAFVDGDMCGELFVLDRIEAKGVSKSIAGRYFSESRAQMGLIDYAMPASRNARTHQLGIKNKGR